MQRLPLLTPAGLLLALFLLPLAALAAPASSGITRISFTERSDGKGYVVRVHTTGRVQGHSLDQSATEVTLTLYNARLEPGLRRGEASGPVQRYTVTPSDDRIVLAFQIDPGQPVAASAYPDRDSDDLLLGMLYEPVPVARGEGGADNASREHWAFDCIVLDAGHGGKDPGAVANGLREKDIALAVTRKVGAYVEDRLGIDVVYTRDDDTFIELHERGRIANESCGKLFVSVHANAARNRRAQGTETFFLGLHRSESARRVMERENGVVKLESDPDLYAGFDDADRVMQMLATTAYQRESERLASLIEGQFEHRADRFSRGVKQAGFLVLWGASMPAVLVELGFLTNQAEARFLRSERGQDLLASAIFRSIRDYKEQYERGVHYSIN
ncbi:MAG: N-acetylmuramoyl-L-alanine amidase [Bacteroidota bacterium]